MGKMVSKPEMGPRVSNSSSKRVCLKLSESRVPRRGVREGRQAPEQQQSPGVRTLRGGEAEDQPRLFRRDARDIPGENVTQRTDASDGSNSEKRRNQEEGQKVRSVGPKKVSSDVDGRMGLGCRGTRSPRTGGSVCHGRACCFPGSTLPSRDPARQQVQTRGSLQAVVVRV